LTATRWSEIRLLFHAVVDLAPSEQRAILEKPGRDPTLVREVVRLLDLHRESQGFLDESLPEAKQLQQVMRGPSLTVGARLAQRFEIRALLGIGGMGEVYRSFDHDIGEEIAVKILRPEFRNSYASLVQEVQTARMVTHRNICRIFDIGRDGELVFVTMELLEGETLAETLRRGPLEPAELASMVEQLNLGLRAAHEAGILHRDLKPGNVIGVPSSRYVITDFGLAHKQQTSGSTRTLQLAGTVGYIAPEVIAGRPHTVASDLYSLGILLHEAATGRLPFDRPGLDPPSDRTVKILTGAGPFAKRLKRVIDDCLQTNPEQRPTSVVDIQRRLSGKEFTRRRVVTAFAAGTVVTAVSLSPGFLRLLDRHQEFGPIDAMLLTPFHNSTGISRFDGITVMLAGQLSQSARFTLVDDGRLHELLTRMQRDSRTPMTTPVAREVALRNGRTAVVYGQVSLLGPDYLLDVKVEEPGSRPDDVRSARDQRFKAAGPDELMQQVRRAALWIREVVGEPQRDRDRYNRAPSEVTTPSWDALALQQQAQGLRANGQSQEAIALLREALRLDPEFASARRDLADLLIAEDLLTKGYSEWLAAVEASRRRQLNTRERFRLEAGYFEDTDDLTAAENIERLWTAAYPRDYLPLFYLGNICFRMFRLPEGLEQMQEAAKRERNLTVLAHLVRHLAMQRHFEDAERNIAEIERAGHASDANSLRGVLELVQGNSESALRSFRAALLVEPQQEFRHYYELAVASILAHVGRDDEAEALLLKAREEDERTGSPQRYGDKLGAAAYLALRRGDLKNARARAIEASAKAGLLNERVALVLARSGASVKAEDVVRRLRNLPNAPRFIRLRTRVEGELSVARGDFKAGIRLLRQADALSNAWTMNDALPRALLLAGQKIEASKYYRVLLDRGALYWYLPGVLAPGLIADASRYAAA
jgi:eukaryotic-like serine/threonine-protein kinase